MAQDNEVKVDLIGARNAGYSDDEIARDLAKKNNFDYEEAVKEGYKPQELIKHFTGQDPLPEGKVTVETSPLQAAEVAGPAAAVARQGATVAMKPVTKMIDAATNKIGDRMVAKVGAGVDPGSLQRYFNTQFGHGFNMPIEEAEKVLGLKRGDLFSPSLLQDASKQLKEMQKAGTFDASKYIDPSAVSSATKGGKTIAQMTAELKSMIPELGGKVVQKSLPYVSVASTAADIQDIMNRLHKDQYGRAIVGGLGLIGSGLSFAPHPILKGAGLAVGAGAPIVNAMIDRMMGDEEPEKRATGGLIGLSNGGQPENQTPSAEEARRQLKEWMEKNKPPATRTYTERLIDMGRDPSIPGSPIVKNTPPSKGASGGAGFTPGTMNPFTPDSPLNR